MSVELLSHWVAPGPDGITGWRCGACGRVWEAEVPTAELAHDFAEHLWSENAPAEVVQVFEGAAARLREKELAERADVRVNPLALRQSERLVPGRDRAAVIRRDPARCGPRWSASLDWAPSSRVARLGAGPDPTSVLDDAGPDRESSYVFFTLDLDNDQLLEEWVSRWYQQLREYAGDRGSAPAPVHPAQQVEGRAGP